MVFVSVSILLSGKYDGSFVLLSCEITRMIIHCPNVQWLHDENLDNVVFGSQTRRENELILWGSNRSNLWKFVILPKGLLRSRPTRGYQIKNVWISQLITFNTTINHWKTLLDRDHERMMELRGKNEIKKRLACYFLHPKFTRKENLLSTWQCWTTCTQWTVSSGMKFVCDWSIILSRNLSHVSVSGSLLCDQILFLLKEWIIDDKLRSHHFQEMNQLSMNNRSAKPLSLINILRPPCFRETRFWDNNYPGFGSEEVFWSLQGLLAGGNRAAGAKNAILWC